MNYLKLSKEETKEIVEELNQLLAEYHLYYQKLRNFHWNIKGKHFFNLHEKFEELYDHAKVAIDEIAERILTLKHSPVSNLSDYLKQSDIEEAESDLSDVDMVEQLVNDHAILIDTMLTVVKIAEDKGDEGTIDLVSGYIGDIEKESWMLNSFISK